MVSGFSKILVCCDGSKYSEAALRRACDLAKKYSSQITLIHVVERTKKSDLLAGGEYTKILRKYAKSSLERAQKIARECGIEPKLVTKEGNIASEVIKFSKSDGTDLIVVGSKGLGAVLQFLLGSVSSKIANHSLCSVLIIK
ncbi:MAG: universal stress protein [Candidatus Nitrosotenuis sp.]|uniref:UspA domain protein n=1 Tax=Candidatus Nitrosotenuis uzonensis TaxID=1407055 RepID=V6AV02_9ARCH|nr:universal stress protein [Candidatus Nitrosotenuis uzonensis]MCA2003513.1 universal stress protein [Candidatus Nitrosotenuis sp.]CDI06379.1 UspA domain protein [Candidatus Nitrosotenuis uzonensis]